MEQPQLPAADIEPQGAEEAEGSRGKQPVHEAAQPGQTSAQGTEQVKDQGQRRPQGQGGEKAPEGLGPGTHPPKSLRRKPPAGRASS